MSTIAAMGVGVQLVAERTGRVLAAAALVDGGGMSYMM